MQKLNDAEIVYLRGMIARDQIAENKRVGIRPAWVKCEGCDDYICTVHPEMHAGDCDCPATDVWYEAGMDPYTTLVTDKVLAWVAANEIDWDEEDG